MYFSKLFVLGNYKRIVLSKEYVWTHVFLSEYVLVTIFYQNIYGWGTSNYKLGASDKKHVMSSFAEKKWRRGKLK